MIRHVRSTTGQQAERAVHWADDDIHPYTDLDGYRIRVTPTATFTQLIDSRGRVRGKVMAHENILTALALLGWEPC